MAQKPVLRGEVGARAMRVRSDVRGHGHGQVRLIKALGCGNMLVFEADKGVLCCGVSFLFGGAPPLGLCNGTE